MKHEARRRLEIVHRFFAGTGQTYDRMVSAATFGIDRRWKKRIIGRMPPNPSRVLDLGCGTGILSCEIASRFPGCAVVGVELRDEYLSFARQKQQALGLTNLELVLCRAEDYRSHLPFDCIVSSYLAKYVDLRVLTESCAAMLTDGGTLVMHDFTYPPRSLRWLFHTYFWLLQTFAGRIFPVWQEIYSGLPELIRETTWTTDLEEALARLAFQDVHKDVLTAYGSAILSATKEHATRSTP